MMETKTAASTGTMIEEAAFRPAQMMMKAAISRSSLSPLSLGMLGMAGSVGAVGCVRTCRPLTNSVGLMPAEFRPERTFSSRRITVDMPSKRRHARDEISLGLSLARVFFAAC